MIPIQSDAVRWFGNRDGMLPSGDIILDGSAYEGEFTRHASVGCAVIALQANCEVLLAGVSGMIAGSFIVDIAGGEFSAFLALLRHAAPPAATVVKSKLVFLGLAAHGPERTSSYAYAWSHLWWEVRKFIDEFGGLCQVGLSIRWVKAHCA